MAGTPYHRLKELSDKELAREAVTDTLDAWVKIERIRAQELNIKSRKLLVVILDRLSGVTTDLQKVQKLEKWDYESDDDQEPAWDD